MKSFKKFQASMKPATAHPNFEPGLSASYKDKEGYTVTVSSKKRGENMDWDHGDGTEHGNRMGHIHITNPKGKKVHSGYWMDFPEHDHPMRKDWDRHVKAGTTMQSKYYTHESTHKRLAREAEIQATRYRPLKDQFKDR